MYQLNAHVLPTESSSKYGQVEGAYAVVFINYADIDGAFELAKYYIENDGWEIDELEEEYLVFESPDDVEEDYLEFYNEALKDGYSLLFNCYERDESKENEGKEK
ncbi:hypothetical protein [Pontibacter populi]|uniref:DUF4288 domain-containing protein n=1 Tax=Pontibacter populi TaxID=890055 RepID=A0ABV1RPH4_9BACT